jgi:hypothetical protein
MPTNSKSELAMNNSIVKVEVKEEKMEAETVEASLPAQDLEVKVEPMDIEEHVSPFPVFCSFLHIPRWGFTHSPPLPYFSSRYQKSRVLIRRMVQARQLVPLHPMARRGKSSI